jgi:hypothetical protein
MTIKVAVVKKSGNMKTGPIPVTTTERASCPSRCAFFSHCYASHGHTRFHWAKVPERGLAWGDFTNWVAALPAGQLWRHNEAGDLPSGEDGTIDRPMLEALTTANTGRRGYTYTHHALSGDNVQTLRDANASGFTVNASCETQAQADQARALGLPAVIVVSEAPEKGALTPAGHPIRRCPAEASAITCAACGICARPDRSAVIAFTAHGPGAKRIREALAKANA